MFLEWHKFYFIRGKRQRVRAADVRTGTPSTAGCSYLRKAEASACRAETDLNAITQLKASGKEGFQEPL